MKHARLRMVAGACALALVVVSAMAVAGCGPKRVSVPNLNGLTQSEADASIANAGLVAGNVTQEYSADTSVGTVFRQDPAAGTQEDERSAVGYVISKGAPPPPQVSVPDVSGMDEKAATSAIEAAQLNVMPYDEYDGETAKGKAFGQVPGAGQQADEGSAVFVGFSLGARPTAKSVPNVVGSSQSSALSRLEKGGFKVSVKSAHVVGAKKGRVVAQVPKSGEKASPQSHVIVLVASGSPAGNVPSVSGKSRHAAATAISNAGMVPIVFHSVSSSVPRGRVMGQLPAAGRQELNGEDVAIVISGGKSSATSPTPGVVGMSKSAALKAITAAGLVPQVVETHDSSVAKGHVVGQVPAAGAKADPDQDVVISISQGPISKAVRTVPSVTGKSKSQAQSALTKTSLGTLISRLFSGRVAKGKVMGQLPKAGAKLLREAPVNIVLSLGKPAATDVAVPNVAGKSRAAAFAALDAAGLEPIDTLVFTATAPPDTAYMQYPTAGTKVKPGSRVVVVMAR